MTPAAGLLDAGERTVCGAAEANPDERPLLLSTLPPTRRQERQALIVALALLGGFVVAVLLRHLRLPEIDAFIPMVASIAFVNDLITATLLFAQFSSVGSRALYVLACGYLLSGLLMVPYVLTFPGAFSPTGLLNAGLQSTVWIFVVWHLTPPTTTLAYVLFKDTTTNEGAGRSPRSAILKGIVAIVAVVCGLTWFVTAHEHVLPAIMQDWTHAAPLWNSELTPLMVALNVLAFVSLWRRRRSVLDLWLLVASFSWLLEMILLHYIDTRWGGNWYIARIFWIASSSVVLLVLIQENTSLYARVVRSNAMLKRERDQKLLNAQAITASIAHEVRQPLGAIVASGETGLIHLAKMPPDVEGVHRSLKRIIDDGHRASQVFEAMRTLFRKGNEERQQVDLNAVILEVVQALRRELRAQQIDIRTELESEMPIVKAHKGQLQEVLINLVSNALEAMAATTDRHRVLRLVTQRIGQRTISVAVEDSGPGIDPHKIDGVFNAFVTTKAQGTGLGLAICRMIIEQHGGELIASSDGKNGALFQFALPVERPEAERRGDGS